MGSTSTNTPLTEPRLTRDGRRKHVTGSSTRVGRSGTRDVSSSDSESEHGHVSADKLSYTEYKRRRRLRDSNRSISGSQDLVSSSSARRSKLSSQSLRSSESSLTKLRQSPEHIYQSIGTVTINYL